MRLNGWMRLWCVIAALWALFVGYLAYTELTELHGTSKYELSRPDIGKVTFVFSSAQSQFYAERHIKQVLIPEVENNPGQHLGKTITAPYDAYVAEHSSPAIARLMATAILPMAALLLLGWSLAWVRRGFRPTHA